jgi:hypothetical protein
MPKNKQKSLTYQQEGVQCMQGVSLFGEAVLNEFQPAPSEEKKA